MGTSSYRKDKVLWVLFVLFVLIMLPLLLCPINDLDGSWYFSQAASVWQGSVIKTHFVDEVMEVGYGLIQVPFAHPALGHYGLMLYHFVFWILLAYSLVRLYSSQLTLHHLLIIAIILTDKIVLLQRPETIVLSLSLFTYILYQKYGKTSILYLGAFFITLLHPPNGILCILGYLTYNKSLISFKWPYIALYIFGIITVLCCFLFLPDTVYVEYFVQRVLGISSRPMLQFFIYSGATLAALLVFTKRSTSPKFWLNYIVLFILALLISPFYYFLLLLLPFILLAQHNSVPQTKYYTLLLVGFLSLNLFANVFHPILALVENTEYGQTVHQNIEHLSSEDWNYSPAASIYISPELGSVIFTQSAKAKMLLFHGNEVSGIPATGPKDIAFAHTTRQREILKSLLQKQKQKYSLVELNSAVKGKLSLKSLYTQRTDSVGLWKFTFQ